MFLISLVPFNVCETYNDEQTSLVLLRDRPSYIWSRIFDALWHFTCMYWKILKLDGQLFIFAVRFLLLALSTLCIISAHCIVSILRARSQLFPWDVSLFILSLFFLTYYTCDLRGHNSRNRRWRNSYISVSVTTFSLLERIAWINLHEFPCILYFSLAFASYISLPHTWVVLTGGS